MPRNYVKKEETYWSNRALEDAIAEKTQVGTSFEKLSKKINPHLTLCIDT